jgi:hypothetical protein
MAVVTNAARGVGKAIVNPDFTYKSNAFDMDLIVIELMDAVQTSFDCYRKVLFVF